MIDKQFTNLVNTPKAVKKLKRLFNGVPLLDIDHTKELVSNWKKSINESFNNLTSDIKGFIGSIGKFDKNMGGYFDNLTGYATDSASNIQRSFESNLGSNKPFFGFRKSAKDTFDDVSDMGQRSSDLIKEAFRASLVDIFQLLQLDSIKNAVEKDVDTSLEIIRRIRTDLSITRQDWRSLNQSIIDTHSRLNREYNFMFSRYDFLEAYDKAVKTGEKSLPILRNMSVEMLKLQSALPDIDLTQFEFFRKTLVNLKDGPMIIDDLADSVISLNKNLRTNQETMLSVMEDYDTLIRSTVKSSSQYVKSMKSVAKSAAQLEDAFLPAKDIMQEFLEVAITPLTKLSDEQLTKYAMIGMDVFNVQRRIRMGDIDSVVSEYQQKLSGYFSSITDFDEKLIMADVMGVDPQMMMKMEGLGSAYLDSMTKGNQAVADSTGALETQLKDVAYVSQVDRLNNQLRDMVPILDRISENLQEWDLSFAEIIGYGFMLRTILSGVGRVIGLPFRAIGSLLGIGGLGGIAGGVSKSPIKSRLLGALGGFGKKLPVVGGLVAAGVGAHEIYDAQPQDRSKVATTVGLEGGFALTGGILGSALGPMGTIAGGLIGGFVGKYIATNLEPDINKFGGAVKNAGLKVAEVGQLIIEKGAPIILMIGDIIWDVAKNTWEVIKSVGGFIYDTGQFVWDVTKDVWAFAGEVWDDICYYGEESLQWISDITYDIRSFIGSMRDSFVGFFKELGNWILDNLPFGLGHKLRSSWDWVKDKYGQGKQVVGEYVSDVRYGVTEHYSRRQRDVIDAEARFSNWAKDTKNLLGKDFSEGIERFSDSADIFKRSTLGYGDSTNAFGDLIGSPAFGNVSAKDIVIDKAIVNKLLVKNVQKQTGITNVPLMGTSNVPLYLQGDSTWGNIQYSSIGDPGQTISTSGCGPTSMAMALTALTGQPITPDMMAEYSLENGFRTSNSGTSWGFFDSVGQQFGVATEQTGSQSRVMDSLSRNQLVVAAMNPGHFTKGGHFILLTGTDGNNIMVNDPASAERSRAWPSSTIFDEASQFWILSGHPKASTFGNFNDAGMMSATPYAKPGSVSIKSTESSSGYIPQTIMDNLGMSGYQSVSSIASSKGVPDWIWVPIMMQESRGDPGAIAYEDNGSSSHGLFQLNTGGQGYGYNTGELMSIEKNAEIGLSHIGNAYDEGLRSGLQGEELFRYVLTHSGHPGHISMTSSSLDPFVDKFQQYVSTAGFQETFNGYPNMTSTSSDLGFNDPFFSSGSDLYNYGELPGVVLLPQSSSMVGLANTSGSSLMNVPHESQESKSLQQVDYGQYGHSNSEEVVEALHYMTRRIEAKLEEIYQRSRADKNKDKAKPIRPEVLELLTFGGS